jgi:hypothetical protein
VLYESSNGPFEQEDSSIKHDWRWGFLNLQQNC